MFFNKKKEEDVVILMNEYEIRQYAVDDETEEALHVGDMVLPKTDAEGRYFPEGRRAFVFGHTGKYLAESENIAHLEKSVVLRNLFDYGSTAKTANIQLYVMLGVLVVTIFLLRG